MMEADLDREGTAGIGKQKFRRPGHKAPPLLSAETTRTRTPAMRIPVVPATPPRARTRYAVLTHRKDEGEAWLSCHPPGKPSLYGSLTCQGIGLDGIPEVTASEGFIVNEINKRVLEGHVFDVNCCRFFPSGLVVLSGGMDAQLKIWSAEDASCVVTFKGHKGGILDTAIVDRGRNVLSGSRDGTARLWDCGRSACLGVLADCGSSINGVAVGAADNSINLGSPEQTPSPASQEVNIFHFTLNPRTPVQVIHRSGAPVLSLQSFRDGFIASQGDGSCFIVQQDLDYVIELTGADCDPVYKVATWEKQIYTCCRDGLVRRYQLADL
ncbi:Proteasomal ATPase-associated factor 1 [Tupaia chinensis]|uniref:Proteasomal ATPase-associated factor 1 n=1 Tax=Tupaia chinensis TaxID=246437 RepID=L9L9U1_TUPCH|nr:Proteasomal ATPase-associated factor 1 [Tupaia chinensis]